MSYEDPETAKKQAPPIPDVRDFTVSVDATIGTAVCRAEESLPTRSRCRDFSWEPSGSVRFCVCVVNLLERWRGFQWGLREELVEFWVLGFGSLVSCNRSRVMAESTSRGIHMEEAGKKAAIASGIEDVEQGAGAYQLLLACPAGVPASLLEVEFSPAYDRQPHPDSALENSIEKLLLTGWLSDWNQQTWEERLAVQPSFFNGSKFRYGGYEILTGSEEMAWATSACLHLGLTDYKTFVGTNLCPHWKHFLAPDVEDAARCRHTASPLGNGAIVKTADHKIVVLQRGSNVGEFPHTLVFPGGHSEPVEIGIKGHVDSNSDTEKRALEAKVAREMFEGITREVVEETGIPASFLSAPLFIGISRRVLNVRPTAFYFIKCTLSSSQVQEYYLRAADGFESSHLLLVPQDELLHVAKKMPGCHHGGAALYDLARKILD